MRLMRNVSVLLLLLLASAPVVSGHHSFFAEFDVNAPITLEGVITRVEWRSPHIWVYIDVTEPDGTVTAWQCEGGAPNALTRNGWTRDTLAVGGGLTVDGYRARNGTNTCNGRTWTTDSGQVLAGVGPGGGAAAPARPNR